MPFTALTNLRQDTATTCLPWEWNIQVPEACRNKKEQYHRWRNLPTISHQFYSPFEGLNPHARITKPAVGTEGNPPCKMHGLVMDVDQCHTDEAIVAAAGSFPAKCRPRRYERTASGNCRLLWEFEHPLNVPNYEFAVHLLKTFIKKWKLDSTLGGFDEPAFVDPSRYYCNGGQWTDLPAPTVVPRSELMTVEYAAATTFSWSTQREWTALPLEKVRDQLLKDHRFAASWADKAFEIGERGPSWWVDGSASGDSAVVFATGMYTFSMHATKAFFPWVDLLGRGYMESATATSVADSVEGIYFDGKQYYRKLLKGEWKAFGKEDTIAYLTTVRRVSAKAPKNGVSDCARALQYVQEHHYVDGAVPVVFREPGLVELNGKSLLNTSTRRAIRPAPGASRGWGVDFPYIASVFDGLFPEEYEGRKFFMSWLAVFYRMSVANALSSGQNVVIAGGPGMGKTLFQRGMLGRLFGGGAEAGDYLMGKDNFGGELFENALWWLDDAGVAANREMHKAFSEALKKMAANRSHKVHVKYAMPAQTQWQGRIMVSCNDDAQSVQMLPSLDMSIIDKLMLFRVPPESKKPVFLPFDEGEAAIVRELPHFGRFLLEWVTPEECRDVDPRFGGVKAFADPYLVRTANHSSSTAPLAEILDDFREQFRRMNMTAGCWEGTAAQLHIALNADTGRKESMRSYPIEKLMTQLNTLTQKGYPIKVRADGEHRVWSLELPSADALKDKDPVITDAASK